MISFVSDLKEQKRTASGFGFEWNAFWKGFFDKGDVFGLNFQDTAQYFLSSTGFRRNELKDLKILDAGTGSGRIPISLQNTGCHVYAVDIHESLSVVSERFAENRAVHFFRADLLQLPFKDQVFDIAWSSGVIHHTPDAAKAFASIARKVKPGGRMFVSVYGTDLHHYRMFRHLMPFARHLPVSMTFALSAMLALPLYLGFNTALALLRLQYGKQPPPYRLFAFTVENIEYKTYRSILLNLFDQLHPKYQSEHSVDEVRQWFLQNGFENLTVVESIGMVGIRGSKKLT
jgi:ubiquinone/menaquinone biosynthesis C-methylase UbiE